MCEFLWERAVSWSGFFHYSLFQLEFLQEFPAVLTLLLQIVFVVFAWNMLTYGSVLKDNVPGYSALGWQLFTSCTWKDSFRVFWLLGCRSHCDIPPFGRWLFFFSSFLLLALLLYFNFSLWRRSLARSSLTSGCFLCLNCGPFSSGSWSLLV